MLGKICIPNFTLHAAKSILGENQSFVFEVCQGLFKGSSTPAMVLLHTGILVIHTVLVGHFLLASGIIRSGLYLIFDARHIVVVFRSVLSPFPSKKNQPPTPAVY